MGTVAKGRPLDREQARDQFMYRLRELVPRCYADLGLPKGLELMRTYSTIRMAVFEGADIDLESYSEAGRALNDYIRAWRERWNLIAVPGRINKLDLTVPEWRDLSTAVRTGTHKHARGEQNEFSWIDARASKTLSRLVNADDYGTPDPETFVPDAPGSAMIINGIDFKAHSLIPTFRTPGEFADMQWNPRTESRSEARKRALARLSAILDSTLDAIELEYSGEAGIPDDHFDYLVRFQVAGDSQANIAKATGLSRRRVLEYVNSTAEYIGLEPRDGRDDAGRPAKRRARTHIVNELDT